MQDISSEINHLLPFTGGYALSQISDISTAALDVLNSDEKRELEAFTNLRRQKEYVTSRTTLKQLAQSLNIKGLQILKDELGQPYGRAAGWQYYISIAHTKEEVFCGISDQGAIGIDMEPTKREVSERLRQRIMHPGEEKLFSKLEPIRLWTIKEAYIKLRGQGLRMNMNEVCLQQKKDDFFVEINNDKRAKICSFQTKGNWLAIAYYL